ncbi:hypothetical protein R3X27_14810 [Tropicimonas sp. TH_r6]|uniref:hypothetical protein n=1 Tax=Tropicimonas sp. TH_r6 TaxID=3082085 RepID=UPI0029550CE5|nr:hypothetical protein [Tropicimonas sp. TH_r6]MDV7143956.1 hypothetical protein [Tropicimonas sp. TH_r6]
MTSPATTSPRLVSDTVGPMVGNQFLSCVSERLLTVNRSASAVRVEEASAIVAIPSGALLSGTLDRRAGIRVLLLEAGPASDDLFIGGLAVEETWAAPVT